MSKVCEQQRELMVEHLLGELDGLVAQRLEAHLEGCDACAQVYARLEAGFSSARRFEPEVDEAELSRWSGRLEPFFSEPERPTRTSGLGFWALTLGGAAAVAVGLLVFSRGATEVAELAPSAVVAAAPKVAPPPVMGPVKREALTEHLRAVTSADFSGRVSRPDAKTTELDIEAGFAVLDFEGGQQRVLRVTSRDVEVRVLGTRFFVEAQANAPTSVGVVSGRVEVRSGQQVEILGAGQVRAYDAAGAYTPDRANLRSAEHHEDAYLRPAPEAPVAAPPPAARRAARPDPVAALTKAERLVRKGRVEEGLRLYERVIASRAPPALRELAEYERARVWGFVSGDRPRAAAAFEALAERASPEVRRQAALARCELDVAGDRCAAAACLRGLEAAGRYVSEVQALLRHWGVSGDTCEMESPAHKTSPGSRPTE